MSKKEEQRSSSVNSKLEKLGVLIGAWDMELSNASFLPDRSVKLSGSCTFEWLEEGGFFVMRQGSRALGPPFATWVVSRDDASPDYTALYFDDRSVSRVYGMSFGSGVWRIWRDSPGFSQRFIGTVSQDGKTIDGCWEKSTDGKRWGHDFDLKYAKRG